MTKRLTVIEENDTQRNIRFKDIKTGKEFSRTELVKQIESGKYPGYHVRVLNSLKTPVSNPDKKESNNLD